MERVQSESVILKGVNGLQKVGNPYFRKAFKLTNEEPFLQKTFETGKERTREDTVNSLELN